MLLNARMSRLLLEAAEEVGVARADVIVPLGLTERELVDEESKVEWATFVRVIGQVSNLVGGDVERLRAIGRRLTMAPSYAPVQQVAATLLSTRMLYELANRWVLPVNMPHLPSRARFVGDRWMLHIEIPPTYAASEAFFHILGGSVVQLPALIGEPPARISESRVSARSLDLVIELPRSPTLAGRVRRAAQGLLEWPSAVRFLEQQRKELVRSVEALQRAREETRVLLDQLPDLVVVHVAGTVVWANRAFVSTLGFEGLDEVVGTSLLDLVAPPHRATIVERMREPIGSDAVPAFTEIVFERRAGGQLTVEVAPAKSVVLEGVPARLVIGRDVTERARMQQQLIVADRLASVGLLAAGVAHEVNNPLGYVLNNIEIARKELARIGAEAETAREVLSVALEGVDRIRAIVHDLLMLARGGDVPIVAIDVRAVAESTLALAAREIDRTARLVRELEPAPLVTASDSRIAQVLLNLVVNALEAMRDRPREENELRVRVGGAGDGRLLLEVSDTGRGIPAPDLPHVFEPFFTTKSAGHGTGLGLAIAQRLVVEMGGDIGVVSEVGRGTTFSVLLPAATATRS